MFGTSAPPAQTDSLPPQSISAMKLMQFQGLKHQASSPISLPAVSRLDLTPSPEVPLSIMKRKLMSTNDLQESRRLVQKIDRHLEVSGGEAAAPASPWSVREPHLCLLTVVPCWWEPGDGALGSPSSYHGSIWETKPSFTV